MSKSNITIGEATKLISDFHSTLGSMKTQDATSRSDMAVASRERLYAVLADAYGKSLLLVADLKLLGQVCAAYGAAPPATDENPHSAVVRMFWRKKDPLTKKMGPDRSAWKYGKGFRAAQALGWTADNYVANLKAYTFTAQKDGEEKVLKGHAALEAYDTRAHGNPEAVASEREIKAAIAWLAKTQQPLATFHADLVENAADKQMANVLVQFDAAAGNWHVKVVNQADNDRAWATIAKPTLAAFDNWLKDKAVQVAVADRAKNPPEGDEFWEALAAHNSEMDRQNALATWADRLVSFETDGDFAWPTSSKVVPITSSDDDQQSAAA